jgi:hypothetical protein
VADSALVARDVERDAECVDSPCLRVCELTSLDFRDARLRQSCFLGEAVLRKTLDAALLADKPSEQHAERIHIRNFQ